MNSQMTPEEAHALCCVLFKTQLERMISNALAAGMTRQEIEAIFLWN